MNNPKRYYIKYDLENESFLLDVSFPKDELIYGIRKVLVTPRQAELYVDRIEQLYLSKNKPVNLNILAYEFDVEFKVCDCGTVTELENDAKRYGSLCRECYAIRVRERWKERFNKRVADEHAIKVKEYLKTDQGKADLIGARNIATNINIQLLKRSKTKKDLALYLGVTQANLSKILYENKSMKLETLYKVCEFLHTPIDLLLKKPRGFKALKKKSELNKIKIKN